MLHRNLGKKFKKIGLTRKKIFEEVGNRGKSCRIVRTLARHEINLWENKMGDQIPNQIFKVINQFQKFKIKTTSAKNHIHNSQRQDQSYRI